MHRLTARFAQLGIVAAVALAFAVMANPAAAANGKALFTQKGCPACHGPNGDKPLQPAYPKLAGQNADYLIAQLKAFKAKQRTSGQSALMWGMAATLSDSDMKAIATWLQKQK